MELTDVTLREGGQMPGRSYTVEQKVEAGIALDRLGVSIVQAGFPITGERDVETIRRLSSEITAPVQGLARAVLGDIDAVLDADADVLDIFAPLSAHHLEHAMGKEYDKMLETITEAVDYARDHGLPTTITLVDAFRTDPDRLVEAFETLSYPKYVTMADTVGVTVPSDVASLLAELDRAGVDLSNSGVHFHEDLGVGTANTLTAAAAGVGKGDVSVANLGERAGNASLEETVVASSLRNGECFGVDTSSLIPVCLKVLETLGEDVDRRKPILGAEVFRHEAGIHTATMLDEPSVFEPFDPEAYGGCRELIFGQGTGRGGARKLLERSGVEPADDTVAAFLETLAAKGPLSQEEALEIAKTFVQ